MSTWLSGHRGLVRVVVVVVALLLGAAFFAVRGVLSQPACGLLFVLLVVGGAATGDRAAGYLAAVASATAFDFFLTDPTLNLKINSWEDVQFAVAMIIVGVLVTEMIMWGFRQRARSRRRAGYLDDVVAVSGGSHGADHIASQIKAVLGVDQVTFSAEPPADDAAVVERDGSVTRGGSSMAVHRAGLPTDDVVYIPAHRAGETIGAFAVVAAAREVWPSREQLQVCAVLADQLGAA